MDIKLRLMQIYVEKAVAKRGLEVQGKVQKYIDSEVLRLSEPYVPKDRGPLIQSGTNNTKVGSGEVVYQTPYARRWYYEPAKFQGAPRRGNRWFERMKANHLESILSGAAKIAGAKSEK